MALFVNIKINKILVTFRCEIKENLRDLFQGIQNN